MNTTGSGVKPQISFGSFSNVLVDSKILLHDSCQPGVVCEVEAMDFSSRVRGETYVRRFGFFLCQYIFEINDGFKQLQNHDMVAWVRDLDLFVGLHHVTARIIL